MSPIDWATRPLKKYADFSGRAPRAEYWWFYLLIVLAYAVAMIVDSIVGIALFGPYGVVTGIVLLALLLPSLAAGVRRLHDTNRTGWWMAAPIVAYAIGFGMMGTTLLDPASVQAGDADLGSMGLAMIFLLIGFALAVTLFVFLVLPGTKGPNKYGDDPYAGGASRAM